MKTKLIVDAVTSSFMISEIDTKYKEDVLGLYYTPFEDGFAKQYPADMPHVKEIYQRFEQSAEEMIKQGPPEGMEGATGLAAITEDFQLKDGLTVTVTIVVEEKTDVLLVPYAAGTIQGGQSYVQVVTTSGETEQRAVQTGITDYQSIEVTEGLSEGEEIIVPKGTAATATTSGSERRPGGVMMFGGPPPR